MRIRGILMVFLAGAAFLATFQSQPAFAEETPRPSPPKVGHRWTVMWAPLRTFTGLAEFTGEYRVRDKPPVVGAPSETFDFGSRWGALLHINAGWSF